MLNVEQIAELYFFTVSSVFLYNGVGWVLSRFWIVVVLDSCGVGQSLASCFASALYSFKIVLLLFFFQSFFPFSGNDSFPISSVNIYSPTLELRSGDEVTSL